MTGANGDEAAALFAAHRGYLFAVAYRMLGSAEEAEDILQDAWLRFAAAAPDKLENPRAYLVTIVTRLALDVVKSARYRREQYIGPWLPEPVHTTKALPEEIAERTESASFAFLLLLERLSPIERAVVVLHDVFDYSHEEIGRMTERSTAASRQILRRAKQKLGEPPRHHISPEEQRVEAFLASIRKGDVAGLMQLLAPDVVLISDGGGLVRAINRPLVGRQEVARFLGGLAGMATEGDGRLADLNGRPAILAYLEGRLESVFVFDTTAAGVTAIYVVRNPEKLRQLGS